MTPARSIIKVVPAVAFFVLSTVPLGALGQQSMEAQREALRLLREQTEETCTRVSSEGVRIDRTFDVEASIDLNNILEKMVGLGLQGGVKYKDTRHRGVLQEDLVPALRDSNNCRLRVLEILAKHLLPDKRASPNKPLPYVMFHSGSKFADALGVYATAEECLDRLAYQESKWRDVSVLVKYMAPWKLADEFRAGARATECERLPQESLWCMTYKTIEHFGGVLEDKHNPPDKVCQLSFRECHEEKEDYKYHGYSKQYTVLVTPCEQFSVYELWKW